MNLSRQPMDSSSFFLRWEGLWRLFSATCHVFRCKKKKHEANNPIWYSESPKLPLGYVYIIPKEVPSVSRCLWPYWWGARLAGQVDHEHLDGQWWSENVRIRSEGDFQIDVCNTVQYVHINHPSYIMLYLYCSRYICFRIVLEFQGEVTSVFTLLGFSKKRFEHNHGTDWTNIPRRRFLEFPKQKILVTAHPWKMMGLEDNSFPSWGFATFFQGDEVKLCQTLTSRKMKEGKNISATKLVGFSEFGIDSRGGKQIKPTLWGHPCPLLPCRGFASAHPWNPNKNAWVPEGSED